MKYSFLYFLLVFAFASCTDDCVTCKLTQNDNTKIEREFCDDGETNFTDQNGNVITFDEVIKEQEAFGFTCD